MSVVFMVASRLLRWLRFLAPREILATGAACYLV
jgi:hypothetical protein